MSIRPTGRARGSMQSRRTRMITSRPTPTRNDEALGEPIDPRRRYPCPPARGALESRWSGPADSRSLQDGLPSKLCSSLEFSRVERMGGICICQSLYHQAGAGLVAAAAERHDSDAFALI